MTDKQNPATLYRCPECGMTTPLSKISLDGNHINHQKGCPRATQELS